MTRARNSANLASQGNLFVDITNDRTGIGSIVPAQNLHVAGTAGFHADTTFVGDLYNATWDRSDNSLKFLDNAKAKFGTGGDLSLYHDGSNSYVNNITGTLFYLANTHYFTNPAVSEIQATFVQDGAVKLYHNGSPKFETTAYGTNITGTTDTDGLVVSGVATVATMNVTGVLTYEDVTSVDSIGIITARTNVHVGEDIVHIGDTDTKIRFNNDTLAFITGGSTHLTITPNNLTIVHGNQVQITGPLRMSSTNALFAVNNSAGTDTFKVHSSSGNVKSVGIVTASSFDGNLNASQLASGTVPTARLGSGTANNTTFLRGDSTFAVVDTNLVADTSPQLGGNLASNGNNINIADSTDGSTNRITFGSSGDLQVFHNGTGSFILNNTGNLILSNMDPDEDNEIHLRARQNEQSIVCKNDGAVELYHNNIKQFETTSSGISISEKITHIGDTDTAISFPSANTIQFDTGGGNRLVINSSGNATFSGNLTVSGDLSVTGSTTQNNSVSTTQKTITLASGAANNAAADGAGIVVDAGSDTDKTIKWLDTTDRWTFTGGDVSANAFHGDGSNLTGLNVAINTLNNAGNNRILTSEGGTTVNSEANLTFGGSTLSVLGTANEKLVLRGSTSPYIRFKEGTNDKAFIQWHNDGYVRIQNQEDSATLRIRDDLDFSTDNSTFHSIFHEGNDGSGSGLDADLLDGVQGSSFLRSDANDTFTGTLTAGQNGKIVFPDNTTVPDDPTNQQHDYITFGANGSISQISGRVGLMIASSDDALVLANGDVGRTFTSSNINVDPEDTYILSDGNFFVKTDLQNGFGSEDTLKFSNAGVLTVNGNTVFHAGNDGSGSGLDADTVDGIQGASFLRSDANDNASGTIVFTDAKGIRLSHTNQVNSDDGRIAAGTHGSGLNIVGTRTLSSGNRQVRIWGDVITNDGDKFWNAANDGSGSGLDADLLDGQQGSYYRNASNINAGTLNKSRLPSTMSATTFEQSNSQLTLKDTDDNKFIQFSYSGGSLIARNNSTNTTQNQFTLTESGLFGIGTIAPSAGDLASGASFGNPHLHVLGNQAGIYELLARFQSGDDTDGSGATIVLNHSNDRGLAVQGGRSVGNRSHGALKSIDNLGRLSNAFEIYGGNGVGVNYVALYTGETASTSLRFKIDAAGGARFENTDTGAVCMSLSNSEHGNNTYNHRGGRTLHSNGTGWDGNQASDGTDPILVLSVENRAGNSDIGDAYGLQLHSESQDNDDYAPMIGWTCRSNSGNYNTTIAAIVAQKKGQAADHNWSSGALHFFTNKPGAYMNNRADMTIDEAGHVQTPYNSRFYAVSRSGNADTGNGVTGLISNQFEYEYVDSNGDFNPSNGRFTAPVDGVYEFHGQLLLRHMTGDGNGEITFYKNNSNISNRSFGYTYCKGSGDHDNLHVQCIVTLTNGDYVDMRIHACASGCDFYYGNGLGFFSGKLLG